MKYLLAEDSESGYYFYKKILVVLGVDKQYNLMTSKGNENYYDMLVSVCELLRNGDSLFLVFDKAELSKNFSVIEITRMAIDNCTKKCVNLYISQYYCFEELFLSYKYLSDMVANSTKNWNEKEELVILLKDVCESILSGKDPYDMFQHKRAFLSKNLRETRTREKFAKSLLCKASNFLGGDLKVDESYLGDCWFSDCEKVEMQNKSYRCPMCLYRAKNKSCLEKLYHFEDNTISAKYMKFSEALLGCEL